MKPESDDLNILATRSETLVGIMQGRLSVPKGGAIQEFPIETWGDEFSIAQKAGLYCIEWIYDERGRQDNPLITDKGISQIKTLGIECQVKVLSICADYYMTRNLVSADGSINKREFADLLWLIGQVEKLGGIYIVLPFVDSSSMVTTNQRRGVYSLLEKVIPILEITGVELHLETDLQPRELLNLITRINHPLVLVNYDIGNSAALGYDTRAELSMIGSKLGSVHVKDRLLGGGTVPLGTGNADLMTTFNCLCENEFNRWFILQAARDKDCSELDLAVRNKEFVESLYSGSKQTIV